MELLDRAAFRRWTHGTGLRWEDSACQAFPSFNPGEKSSAWPWPKPEGHTRLCLFAEFIPASIRAASLDKQGGYYLWPLCGRWTVGFDQWPVYRVRNLLLERLGIPVGFDGCLYFAPEEVGELVAVVYARCSILDVDLGDATDDVVVYPSHGELHLHFHHEEITWGLAPTVERLQEFDKKVEGFGWGWLRDEGRNQCNWSRFLGDSSDQAAAADRPRD